LISTKYLLIFLQNQTDLVNNASIGILMSLV